MIDPKNDAMKLRQLPLDLDIHEAEGDDRSFIAPEEAARISEMARITFEELRPGAAGEGQTPAWMDDYRQLREAGWPWRVAVYIAWAASPKKNRVPKTQEDLATKCLGLTSDRQISIWRKKNPVIDETITILQAAPLIRHRRDIYDALVASATTPDYKGHQDRKLALELLGDYVQKRDVRLHGQLTSKDVTEKSDDELRALLGTDEEETEPGGEE